jgi:hypothetical protein
VEQHEGYYKLGTLGGRYNVFVVPKLTEKRVEYYGADRQLKEIDVDEYKIFICKLTDVTKILDVDNYIKIGVVKINKNLPLFE